VWRNIQPEVRFRIYPFEFLISILIMLNVKVFNVLEAVLAERHCVSALCSSVDAISTEWRRPV